MRHASSTTGMQTKLIHSAREAHASASVAPPIYQTSTYVVPSPEEGAMMAAAPAPKEFYGRYSSPNAKQAEVTLAALEGGEAALVTASGMAAVTTSLLAVLQAGDHVIAQHTHYTASLTFFQHDLPRRGVEVTLVDQRDTEAFARALRPTTRVIYTETPTNPTMELTDLRATAQLAHQVGALAITDNTFATPYNQHPLELGYDLVVHSATKYLNGHADVVAGVVIGTNALIEQIWHQSRILGPVLHPFDAWLLRRGLQTFGLRMAAHNRNALEVARFLESHPAVTRVCYPGLASHPQHDLARRQMVGGFGGMLSFEVKGGYGAARRVVGKTKLCLLAVSLGGVESLITLPADTIHGHQSANERDVAGIGAGLIRLSVGVEDAPDIIADLDQALKTRSTTPVKSGRARELAGSAQQ